MLNDYKGEKPNNVITEEEHKKRPFYKKVSFWVLSALGLFFGGCSFYGLVLGYQYVHAVTEAAHIIADAQSEVVADSGDKLNKSKSQLFNSLSVTPDQVAYLDMGSLNWSKVQAEGTTTRFIATDPSFDFPSSGNVTAKLFCSDYFLVSWNRIFTTDHSIAGTYSGGNFVGVVDSVLNDLTANEFKAYISGKVLYYLPRAGSTYQSVYGHGYSDGYDEGYSDGSDAINLPQSVKVLLPVGNEYSVQYKSYVDGVVDRQGQLNSSQTGGAYATFDRSRTQKLRIDLTLPSGSRAFFLYTPSWTSAYPNDENYSLRQSWAVSGVTYLPTWVSKPQIYVGVTPADVPDLTYETISVAFDVDHWGDIKVGAYSQGYNDGFQAGEENPTAYDSGYDAGYEQGYDDGHTIGVAQGESQAVSGQKALVNMFVTAFQQPFDQIYRFLNFNVLGLNILALFTALLTLSIGIIIIKKVI